MEKGIVDEVLADWVCWFCRIARSLPCNDCLANTSGCARCVSLRWRPLGEKLSYPSALESCFGDTPANAFARALQFIDTFPSAEEIARDRAIAKMADALEAARAANLEPEFVNPLEIAMKKLAENAITDKRGADHG